MDDPYVWLILVGMIVLLFQLTMSILVIVIGIIVILIIIPPVLVIYFLSSSVKSAYEHYSSEYDSVRKFELAILLTIILGLCIGSLITNNFARHTSIAPYVLVYTSIFSGISLGALIFYPYFKYFSEISAYRRKEKHLIKP